MLQPSRQLCRAATSKRVVFAKWIEASPSLLVLDDPTRGIDVSAKREMHRIMRQPRSVGEGGSFFLQRSMEKSQQSRTAPSSSSTAC